MTKSCPECQGTMTRGYVPDNTYGTVLVSVWAEGEPRTAWWGGIRKAKNARPIETWRCGRCGC